jgi:hypothetical protein
LISHMITSKSAMSGIPYLSRTLGLENQAVLNPGSTSNY